MNRVEILTQLNHWPRVLCEIMAEYAQRTWAEKLLASFQDNRLVLEANDLGLQLRFTLHTDEITAEMVGGNPVISLWCGEYSIKEFIHGMETMNLDYIWPQSWLHFTETEKLQYKSQLDAIIAMQIE